MGITLIIVLVLIAVGVLVFFKTAPQIGGKPAGERLERMKRADNYNDGVFLNTVETKMDMKLKDFKKLLRHYLFADKSKKSPASSIEVVPFHASHFTAIPDSTLGVSWFGHSSLLLKIDGVTILTDPVLDGKRASMFSFMGPRRFRYKEYVQAKDLPPVDAVIISHDHYDHLDYPTITALKEKVTRFYMPLGVGAHFEKWGIGKEQIVELEWWQEVQVGNLKLVLTPTRHFSGRALNDRFCTLWGSWVLQGSKSLYFSGDSGYFSGFKEIGEKYGPFDLTFMECGAYNESWSEIHMFPEETAQAHLDVKGKLLMPIHWGKFDLSLHDWKESVDRLSTKATKEGIELFTPKIGDLITVKENQPLEKWWKQVE